MFAYLRITTSTRSGCDREVSIQGLVVLRVKSARGTFNYRPDQTFNVSTWTVGRFGPRSRYYLARSTSCRGSPEELHAAGPQHAGSVVVRSPLSSVRVRQLVRRAGA